MLNEHFVWLGLLIGATGVGATVVATIKGRVKPNRLSWFIIGCAPLIAFAAELDEGVGIRSAMTFWVGFGPMLIFFASFANKDAYWKLTRFDFICGALAVVALVLWPLTGSGNVAIALTIAADGFAMLPIIVKSWRFPHTEVPWPFAGGLVNSAIALLVLDRWNFADFAFPVYIFVVCFITMVIIVLRKRTVGERQVPSRGEGVAFESPVAVVKEAASAPVTTGVGDSKS
jgi:hypothetical protein